LTDLDTRYRRITAHLDDLRTELTDIEDESPPQLRHLHTAHSAVNDAIRAMHYALGMCEICGGVGKVRRALRVGHLGNGHIGFDWTHGDTITCPACGGV